MLLQFTVENFLSFREETAFSMLAPPGVLVGTTPVPGQPAMRVMRAAALYGANASGKSNLVEAMKVSQHLIARGVEANKKLPARPFKLDASAMTRPSRFQYDFVVDESHYSYSIEFVGEGVRAEALYRMAAQGDERLVFAREAPDGSGAHEVRLGDALLEGDDEQRQFARFVARGTRVNQPLLTEFAQRNVSERVSAVWRWFDAGLWTVKPTQNFENLVAALSQRADLLSYCADSLARFGTGVKQLELRLRPPHSSLEGFAVAAHQQLGSRGGDDELSVDEILEIDHSGHALDTKTGLIRELLLLHEGAESPIAFSLREESDGTRRLLHLLPLLFEASRVDRTVVVDELDRSLHTALTRRFVEDFYASGGQGDARSQLVFSTHDTNLLNGRLVPPASIWFVEKDPAGATRLHSLSEYRDEQLGPLLDRLEDGYLQGRFGAIPFLAPRASLHWSPDGSGKAA